MSETFSQYLLRRYAALKRGRSQRVLATRIGVDHATLSRWSRGQRAISSTTIDRLLRWIESEEQRLDRRGSGGGKPGELEEPLPGVPGGGMRSASDRFSQAP